MNARTLAAALLLAVGANASFANTAAEPADKPKEAQAAPAAQAAAADDESKRVICRSERPVGSNIPKRICKTAAQWEQEREQARKMIGDMQQRTGSSYGR